MMRAVLAGAALVLGAALPLVAQDDVLQLKNGSIVRGRVRDATDKGIELEISANNVIFYRYDLLNPYSAYSVRRKRLDKESPDEHETLARFCKEIGLTGQSVHHFREAARLDPRRTKALEQEILELRTAAAAELHGKAKEIIEGARESEYEAAAEALHKILDEFFDTPYGEEAKKLDDALAQRIRDLRTAREKEVEKEKKDREQRSRDKQVKEPLEKIESAVKEVQTDWATGLEYEGGGTSSLRAIQAWQAAEQKLLMARAAIDHLKTKTQDSATLERLAEMQAAADVWAVRIYLSLARAYAAENLDYYAALRWCNKALKIAPDNELVWQLKFAITEPILRTRIESSPSPK